MNVEIGAEAAQLPEKEYINGIAVAVQSPAFGLRLTQMLLTFSYLGSSQPFWAVFPLSILQLWMLTAQVPRIDEKY
jgi:hypothetical protein